MKPGFSEKEEEFVLRVEDERLDPPNYLEGVGDMMTEEGAPGEEDALESRLERQYDRPPDATPCFIPG